MNILKDFLMWSIIAASITWVSFNGGRIEGLLVPVMAESKFTVTEDEDPFFIRVYGDLNKIRGACGFRGLEFFLGGVSEARVPSTYVGSTKARGEGEFQTEGYWRVQMTKEDFETKGVVKSNHDCPYTPWLVVTRLK